MTRPGGYNGQVPQEDDLARAMDTPAPGEMVPELPKEEAQPALPLAETPSPAPVTPAPAAEPAAEPPLPALGGDLVQAGADYAPLDGNKDVNYLATLLPVKRTLVKTDFGGSTTLIYGPEKIGKSDLASQYPGALFLATEEGHKHLSIYKKSIQSWQHYKDVVQALITIGSQQELPYKTIVVDTVDLLFDFCTYQFCYDQGIEHPSEQPYGKGWSGLKTEWQKGIYALIKLGYSVVFVSHSKERTVTMNGIERDVIRPSLSNSASSVIMPSLDYIIYLDHDTSPNTIDGRRMVLRGDDTVVAGDRSGLFSPVLYDISYKALLEDFKTNVVPGLQLRNGG